MASFKNNGKLKLLIIVGTRPEIIRLAAVITKARQYFDCILAHTGQNYDYNLNGVFFKDLELADPEVGVILLDFITGPGVAYDPITSFAEECRKYKDKGLVVISNICGSAEDPQDVAAKQKLLEEAGVIVTPSNFQSTKLASAMMNAMDRREAK